MVDLPIEKGDFPITPPQGFSNRVPENGEF
jgi:hypothetical protein